LNSNSRRGAGFLHNKQIPVQIFLLANVSCFYPTYIRGEAYLTPGQGTQAAAEFQRILDHSSIVWNC
jgi:hypothetical protein